MATKVAPKKKSTTKVSSKKTTSKKHDLPVGILTERNPENHKVTGKYTFFYALFACTTLIFAGIAVWLYIFSSELLNKYEDVVKSNTTCQEVSGYNEDYTEDGE